MRRRFDLGERLLVFVEERDVEDVDRQLGRRVGLELGVHAQVDERP